MVTLVSTLHDPTGRMVDAATRLYSRLADLYQGVVVVPTSSTSPRLLDSLGGAVVQTLAESDGSIGVGRRHALRLGIELGAAHLHYCDFDRILHWIGHYPRELASVLEAIQQHDYLIIGRTERAFATHPRVQRDTETITNHAFSLWYGEPVDVTAGSCGLSRRAADLLLRRSTAPTNATDAEWPALVRQAAGYRVGSVQTEGLEFETPDYFRDEIEQAGSLERWLEERSKPLTAWITRTRLTLDSLQAALAVIEGR
ncbi:MAG: hypothetical protein ACM3US_10195 [Sphingomonadaceae bacterium]